MRQKGRIATWKDDRGFGFVSPDAGGDQVFLHITAFSKRGRRPDVDDVVTFEVGTDAEGRPQAKNVAFVGGSLRLSAPLAAKNIPLTIGTVFLVLLLVGALLGKLPWLLVAIYSGASLFTFCMYAIDKSAAQSGMWRTPESTLQLWGLLGGWPGAAAAQTILRHKSKKLSFRIVFWIMVMINCSALGWLLLFPEGQALLSSAVRFFDSIAP
ncbi:MAG: DUF1294 domain-containing protein [bacterium]|nr:DUF1294 domain-containing protein [bacterium]